MPFRHYEPADASDWLALLNPTRATPLRPNDFAAREAAFPASDFRLRLIYGEGATLLAIGQVAQSPYAPQDHLSTTVIVAAPARRRGIGSAMLERLRQEVRARDYSGLVCDLHETQDDVLRWARFNGFQDHIRRFSSELDLALVDPEGLRLHVDDAASRGISVFGMDEAPAKWADFLSFFRQRVSETPDLEEMPAWDFERCRAIVETNPNGRADWTVVARRNGELLGTAVMHRHGSDAYIFFVGVAPQARGQRVAPALVATLALRARSQGCRLLKIDNLDRNAPALRVNERLGFLRRLGRIELRRSIT